MADSRGWRWTHVVNALVWTVLLTLALAVTGVWAITNTDWGRERVRRIVTGFLTARINGHAQIGLLTGNLLTGVVIHNLSITDSAGQPFVLVETVRAKYSLISLVQKELWFYDVVAWRPLVVLDRPPDGKWNFQRIFPRDTTHKPPSGKLEWGDWLRFTESKVVHGQLIVRSPWHPSHTLRGTARDSAIRAALSGRERLLVERVPGGFQKISRLDSIIAAVPVLRITQPGSEDRLAEVSSARMIAYPLRPPSARVRNIKGAFPFNNDSVWWKKAHVAMPGSRANGDGFFSFDTGDLRLKVHVEPLSFADTRWIFPRIPESGRGKLDLSLAWVGSEQRYDVTNAALRLNGAHAAGDVLFTINDTIALRRSNVRFAGVDTRTLEELLPGFSSPRQGTFAGNARVRGGRHALALDTDLTFDDREAGVSRVIADGDVGLPGRGVRLTNMRLQMLPVQVTMARTWYPTLPIAGVVTGTATLNGNTSHELAAQLNIEHRDRGTYSAIGGSATVQLAPSARVRWFDVNVVAQPISLVTVGRFVPDAGLHGGASGPLHLTGTFSNVRVDTDLLLPDGGRIALFGTVIPAGRATQYDLAARFAALDLRTITTKLPITSLTAVAAARGKGFDPLTMRSSFVADFAPSQWDSIAVDTASVRATLDVGFANIEKLIVTGSHTKVSVAGTFGLTATRRGKLAYHLVVDSLGAFNRWIPRRAGAATTVEPRPGVTARALQRARADSAQRDRATEMERMITGQPGPQLVYNAPKAVAADTLLGTLDATGTIEGNLHGFDLRGRARGEDVVARGNFARRFASEYAWIGARTPKSKIALAVDADSLSALGFAFDTLNVRVTYNMPERNGHAEVVVIQDEHREYSAKGDYALGDDRNELRLASATFRFDSTFWRLLKPTVIAWGSSGVRVADFELRDLRRGRIYASGVLPTEGSAEFRVDVEQFPVSNIVDIAQTSFEMSGILFLHGLVTGTLRSPVFRGIFTLEDGTYNGVVVPDLDGRFAYSDRELVAHVDAKSADRTTIVVADGRLPIDLAVTGVTGDRLLPLPMSADIVADSLPLELIPQFTDVVSDVHGRAGGKLAVRGYVKRPVLVGGFTLDRGEVTVTATGTTLEEAAASVRVLNDTIYVDSITGWAKGRVRLRGEVGIANWSEPTLNLYLTSDGAELLHNKYGKLHMDAGLALTGPFRQAFLSGEVTVTRGVIYAPEPSDRHLIGAEDPAIFNVLDTTITSQRELFPAPSPILSSLRAQLAVSVHHNTWVRNHEANIEIYTDDPVYIRMEQLAISLTGIVDTDRGEYTFLSKRFQIKRGSATFIGGAEVNPTLQVTGEYQVQTAARGALNIRVLIGGTLQKPRLTLESDAQPPKTQSELLSLLAFGQSTTALLASGASSIAGTAATADLFGVGARTAVKRLAGVAMGVAVAQVEIEVGRAFGLDVFNITPADVPSGNIVGGLFQQTKIEAGKYINPRTFVNSQYLAGRGGISIEHRSSGGWLFKGAFEPRLLLREPRLNEQPVRLFRSYGGFIVRDWRF